MFGRLADIPVPCVFERGGGDDVWASGSTRLATSPARLGHAH